MYKTNGPGHYFNSKTGILVIYVKIFSKKIYTIFFLLHLVLQKSKTLLHVILVVGESLWVSALKDHSGLITLGRGLSHNLLIVTRRKGVANPSSSDKQKIEASPGDYHPT